MEIQALEVYASDSNCAIIKPPGRRFPGSVIQGDTLHHLCRLASKIAQHVRAGLPRDEEFMGELDELVDLLVDRTLHYQAVLQRHGLSLPFPDSVTEADRTRPHSESGNGT